MANFDTQTAQAQNTAYDVYSKGIDLRDAGNLAAAARNFDTAAKAGYPPAQYELALAYFHGLGIPCNTEKAVSLFNKVVKGTDKAFAAEALCCIGYCHLMGIGFPQSDERAMEYYIAATDQGSATARSSLAMLQLRGSGTSRNVKNAITNLQLAFDAGDGISCFWLAERYMRGIGVRQNYMMAAGLVSRPEATAALCAVPDTPQTESLINRLLEIRHTAHEKWKGMDLG